MGAGAAASLLLALVGAFGEVGVIGDSDGGDFFVPDARTAATVLLAHVGAVLVAATANCRCAAHPSS
jgi:hypothetical protein